MAVREIIRIGHPALRQKAQPITAEQLNSAWLDALLVDMQDTLQAAGGIGLAAPQIAESYRVAIVDIPGGPTRYGALEPAPLTAYINPVIEVLDASLQGFFEGCLSVPGLRGYVERPGRISVRFLDTRGDAHVREYDGFLATVMQHEFDHLDGRIYIDRMTDTTKLVFEAEFAEHWAEANVA